MEIDIQWTCLGSHKTMLARVDGKTLRAVVRRLESLWIYVDKWRVCVWLDEMPHRPKYIGKGKRRRRYDTLDEAMTAAEDWARSCAR